MRRRTTNILTLDSTQLHEWLSEELGKEAIPHRSWFAQQRIFINIPSEPSEKVPDDVPGKVSCGVDRWLYHWVHDDVNSEVRGKVVSQLTSFR